MATFQRARTADQRAERTAMIMRAARSMLSEMPLAAITLTGLARSAGLAPSNVLRYFDSREAVLLQLVTEETEAWLNDLVEMSGPVTEHPRQQQCVAAAAMLATSLEAHPTFCELISAQAVVLERKVSVRATLDFKIETGRQLRRFAGWLTRVVPELTDREEQSILRLAARTTLIVGALWAQHTADELVTTQLAEYPEAMTLAHTSFADAARETVTLVLLGAVSLGTP